MSALTKTFVLLHVVMSMLLAAGLIVFINRVDDYQAQAKSQKAAIQVAEQKASDAMAQFQTQRSAMENMSQTSTARIQQIQTELAARDKEILDLKTQVANFESQAASDKATLKSTSDGLKVAQENQGVLQGQLADLRTNHDKLMQQFTEANLSINDLNAKLNQTERVRRDLAEQLAAANERGAQAGARSEGQRAPGVVPNANVNGVIREKRVIAGVPYATISIGSSDAVSRGMRLRVLGGRNGQEFLGYVDVSNVEPEEAIGRLSGPRVNEITVNNQVVSQL